MMDDPLGINPTSVLEIPIARSYLLLGVGDLLQEAGSPGGRPQKSISQLL